MRCVFLHFLMTMAALGVVRAQPALTLEAATDRRIYLEQMHTQIYLEARVHASAAPGPASATVSNIAFVLDRSGSMAGEPMQALRQGLAAAINSLAERDIVSVVLFGSEVETLLEAQRRDQVTDLDALLARMEPAGGSALYDALNQGAAQLRRYAGAATVNHLVLLTDGPPTKGPRELDDFTRLAGVFAREGITVSTIGLGPDFGEDLLAALARIGNGRFRYVDRAEKIGEALQAELAPLRTPVARDVVLTIEFNPRSEEVTSYGWEQAGVADTTVTYRFPHLFADQDLDVLASVKLPGSNSSAKLATVRLSWKDLDGNEVHETTKALSVIYDPSPAVARSTVNREVVRVSVATLISEGMQKAIEELDKGDFRRVMRALRRARDEAKLMNNDLEDAPTAAKIRQLEAYLADVEARGLNQLDRKILRSGLFNQFASPTKDSAAE